MRSIRLFLPLLLFSCNDPVVEDPPETDAIEMDSSLVVDGDGWVPDLICPGARGCETAVGHLAVGVAKWDITPLVGSDPVWMAGFSIGRQATANHDPIWIRALSLRQGATRLGMVVLDTVGYFHDDVLEVRRAAAGLEFDHILVASTHNHETKDTMGIWGAAVGQSGRDPAYLEAIVDGCVAALTAARDGERTAELSLARSEAPALVHDSRQPEVIDPSLHLLAFRDVDDGAVFATLLVWGNHPEALGGENTVVTSDYPHYLREHLEAEYPGSTAVFFNGILGGLANPLHVVGCPDGDGNETCANGTFEKAAYIGEGVADVAVAALAAQAEVAVDPSLSLRRHSFLVGSDNLPLIIAFQLGLFPRSMVTEEGEVLAPEEAVELPSVDLLEGRVRLRTEVNAFQIGPAALLTVPGELYAELWLEPEAGGSFVETPVGADHPEAEIDPPLQSYLPTDGYRIIINQANDALGYIIPKSQWDTLEPRAYDPGGQYGEQNSTGPDTAGALHDAVVELYGLEVE